MTYNPFNKRINEPLNADDLRVLLDNHISEGYHVEYKGGIFPANAKIGHSIASLANTYGGWYIVGVETNGANVANNLVGFDVNVYPDAIGKVREVVKEHVDPTPQFYIQQVPLPDANRAVLVVFVPPNQDTPYITKDGRIYRRTHDSSDPVPEANRYTIDRLIDEGRKAAESFARFCRDERTFSKHEAENNNVGWLSLFVDPYSYEEIVRPEWEKADLQRLLETSKELFDIALGYEDLNLRGCLPFNSAYPTQKSVVLKQSNKQYSAFNSLVMELYYNGRAKFHIPIRFFTLDLDPFHEERLTENGISARAVIRLFEEISNDDHRDEGFDLLRFFDAGELSMSVVTLCTFYLNWLKFEEGLITDFKLAIRIDGAWRAVPYFNDDAWAQYVNDFGFPIGRTDTVIYPELKGKGLKIGATAKSSLGETITELTGLMFGFPPEVQHLAFGHYLQHKLGEQNQQQSAGQ